MNTSRRTILIVEDDRDYLDLLARFFSVNGFSCRTATDARAAVASLETDGLPTVIVTDLIMPGMDGLALLGHTQNAYPTPPPVIVISGGKDGAAETRARSMGASAYLEKPLNLRMFLDIVEITVEDRAP